MRIDTYTCPDCGTIVAANVLERQRCLRCPGLGCETVHRFEDLPDATMKHYAANQEEYRMR